MPFIYKSEPFGLESLCYIWHHSIPLKAMHYYNKYFIVPYEFCKIIQDITYVLYMYFENKNELLAISKKLHRALLIIKALL